MRLPNYNIIKEIGSGGMGTVYLAEHTLIKRKVAVKSLKQELISNNQLRERFKKEAYALAQLEHPNIVRLNEYIEQQDGIFLIMEYVDGLTLDDYINTVTGPINEGNLVPLFSQLLDAFDYAHKKRIVHRDIKPSNIIITNEGSLKVLDFGIARIDESNSMTKTGTQIGTVFYMSPEQVRGEKVNHLSDIYSLGVTLFQMATGKTPYDINFNEYQVFKKIDKEPLPIASSIYPGVSERINEVIKKATAKNTNKRFQSCKDFKIALTEGADSKLNESTLNQIVSKPSKIITVNKFYDVIFQVIITLATGMLFTTTFNSLRTQWKCFFAAISLTVLLNGLLNYSNLSSSKKNKIKLSSLFAILAIHLLIYDFSLYREHILWKIIVIIPIMICSLILILSKFYSINIKRVIIVILIILSGGYFLNTSSIFKKLNGVSSIDEMFVDSQKNDYKKQREKKRRGSSRRVR